MKEKRNKEIEKLYRDGLSLREVANKFNITAECVRLVLKSRGCDRHKQKLPLEREIRKCLTCGKEIYVLVTGNRKYCSRTCSGKQVKNIQSFVFTIEERKELAKLREVDRKKWNNERQKIYYQRRLKGNPEFIKKTKERNDRYTAKLKAR